VWTVRSKPVRESLTGEARLSLFVGNGVGTSTLVGRTLLPPEPPASRCKKGRSVSAIQQRYERLALDYLDCAMETVECDEEGFADLPDVAPTSSGRHRFGGNAK
jgi:hypothetical protein